MSSSEAPAGAALAPKTAAVHMSTRVAAIAIGESHCRTVSPKSFPCPAGLPNRRYRIAHDNATMPAITLQSAAASHCLGPPGSLRRNTSATPDIDEAKLLAQRHIDCSVQQQLCGTIAEHLELANLPA